MMVRTVRLSCLVPSALALVLMNVAGMIPALSAGEKQLVHSFENLDPFLLGFALLLAAGLTLGVAAVVGSSLGAGRLVPLLLVSAAVLADRFYGRLPGAADLAALGLALYCLTRNDKQLRIAIVPLILARVLFQPAGWLGPAAVFTLLLACAYRLLSGRINWLLSSGESECAFDCLLFLTVGSRMWSELTVLGGPQIGALLYIPTLFVLTAGLYQTSSGGLPEEHRDAVVFHAGSLGEYLATAVQAGLPAWSELCERLRRSSCVVSTEEGRIAESEHVFLGYRLSDSRTARRPIVQEAVLLALRVLSRAHSYPGAFGLRENLVGDIADPDYLDSRSRDVRAPRRSSCQ